MITTNLHYLIHFICSFRIFPVIGDQRIDHEHSVDRTKAIEFYIDNGSPAPDCSLGDFRCTRDLVLSEVGTGVFIDSGVNGTIHPNYGSTLKLSIPAFMARGSHG